MKIGVGGRGVSMGEAQTAAVNDTMALYWNPAALGKLNYNEAAFMHNNFIQGVDQDALFYAQPTHNLGTFGAGLTLVRVGGIAGYNNSGIKTKELTATDTMITLGWGKVLEDVKYVTGLQTGLNLKSLSKKLGDDSASTMMADLGLLYEVKDGPVRNLRTAMVVQNLGGGVNFNEKSDLPRLIKLGFAYPFFGNNLTTALDLVSPSDNSFFFNFGLDYRIWDILAFRLGYKGQNDLGNGITYGVSFGNERLHLDYAFVPFGDMGDTQRISVGIRFGKAYREAQVQSQITQAYERAEARYAQGYLVEAYIQAAQIMDVAPWHRPTRNLMRGIEDEFQHLEDIARREQLQAQIDEHYSRGEQHFQLDELIPAKREFEAILALQPTHSGAKTYLKRIDDRFKSIVQNFYESAMRHFAAGNYKDAKDFFEKVLVVDPANAEAREQLSRTEKLMGDAQKAADERARLETIRPVYHAALSAFEKKEYDEALKRFEEVLSMDTENNEARRYRLLCKDLLAKQAYEDGNDAAQNGEWSRASDSYKRALRYKPDFSDAQAAMEKVRSHLGEQQKTESQKMYKLGLEAFLSGDQAKAMELWQKAVDMDPENLEAKRGLERITSKRGNGNGNGQ
ncbi:MAG: PorV/PorQ family protein [Elusimicrobia bacterium]|nr:PorV/PorQ family protein [Elusimicrobiota bacterium]